MSLIIDTIFRVGESVFGLRGELAKARQARKQQVADFLAAIAQTIETTSAILKQGNYPSGTCQEILTHSEHMNAAIGDLIGDPKATDLAQQLKEVHEVEQLYHELSGKTEDERVRSLHVLDQAAGLFRATAAFVRVSP